MTPVRIIGVGSAHGADAAGWWAIEALQRDGWAARFPPGTVSLQSCPTPVQLYRLVEGCCLAVLIDALASDAPQPLSIPPAALRGAPGRYSVHGVGVADMLDLLDTLAVPPPRVLLFGLPVAQTVGRPAAKARLDTLLPALAREVEEVIRLYLEDAPSPRQRA